MCVCVYVCVRVCLSAEGANVSWPWLSPGYLRLCVYIYTLWIYMYIYIYIYMYSS